LLEKELSRAIRRDDPLSLVILDIDQFKEINDHYGHLTGDLVLKNFAELIQRRLRGADTLTRWGGEEFAILLPDTTGRGALLVAEDIRHTIAHHEIAPGVHITVSAGVAEYQPGETTTGWFIRVDNALYEAKKSGRNCVISAPMPSPDNG
jgi:diguanylate cyclase (GGDEF) domain